MSLDRHECKLDCLAAVILVYWWRAPSTELKTAPAAHYHWKTSIYFCEIKEELALLYTVKCYVFNTWGSCLKCLLVNKIDHKMKSHKICYIEEISAIDRLCHLCFVVIKSKQYARETTSVCFQLETNLPDFT